jgi:hypothetical protein
MMTYDIAEASAELAEPGAVLMVESPALSERPEFNSIRFLITTRNF